MRGLYLALDAELVVEVEPVVGRVTQTQAERLGRFVQVAALELV